MLFKKKKVDEFRDLLKSSFKDVSNQDFDKVLKIYSKILAKHDLLLKEDQDLISQEYERLILELRIYMHIKEAEILINFGDFNKIEDKLTLINALLKELKPQTDDSRQTLSFSDKKLKELNSNYEHKLNIHRFNSLYLQAFKHIKHKKIVKAIEEYHNILNAYQIILKYESPEKFKPKLDKLIKALEDLALVKKAYEKVISQEIKVELPNYVEVVHRDLAPTKTQDFSKEFNKIHELLEKDKYNEAEKLYQNL